MGITDTFTSSALSFAISGNCGISPFLTLFLVGCIEVTNPDLLTMSPRMENLISSWWTIAALGAMTVLEFSAKCIPFVDECIDSIIIWIVPVMSVLGTISTFGVYHFPTIETDDDEDVGGYYDNNGGGGGAEQYYFDQAGFDDNDDDDARRRLTLIVTLSNQSITQIVVLTIGIGLAVSVHMFKMLVRVFGETWLTKILTILETCFCVFTVILAVLIKETAMIVAGFFFFIAGYNLFIRLERYRMREGELLASEQEERMRTRYRLARFTFNLGSRGNDTDDVFKGKNKGSPKSSNSDAADNDTEVGSLESLPVEGSYRKMPEEENVKSPKKVSWAYIEGTEF